MADLLISGVASLWTIIKVQISARVLHTTLFLPLFSRNTKKTLLKFKVVA